MIGEDYKKVPRVRLDSNLYCYNVDENYRCMAYSVAQCHAHCQAKIGTLRGLLKLYRSLRSRSLTSGYGSSYHYELDKSIKRIEAILDQEEDKDIKSAYFSDIRRGKKGGSSESDSNRRTGLKQLMKDNRPVECKPTSQEREDLKQALQEWEDEHGKLPKLSRR